MLTRGAQEIEVNGQTVLVKMDQDQGISIEINGVRMVTVEIDDQAVRVTTFDDRGLGHGRSQTVTTPEVRR